MRNPWGAGEWKGDWGDDWLVENRNSLRLSSEQQRKLRIGEEADDGMFWMAWKDFIREFEALTVCHLEDNRDTGMCCIVFTDLFEKKSSQKEI